ncbi:hypothetical protein GCK32_011280 [Trichostrongylus colubriformis]|uniref:SXP/RAL-2 family protein Ani s 5-like cation-binding domain-containing protein n=1 Tax=Trichostrongylus colubriformis TaxID=6319 RepID=A0AAN8IEA5_TRICO
MKSAIILLVITATAHGRTEEWSLLETVPRIVSRFHFGPPPLALELAPFVTTEAQREYHDIRSNRTLTIGEQEAKIKQWAESNDISKQVLIMESNIMNIKNRLKEQVKEVINWLPVAFQEFSKVVENKNLTLNDIQQQAKKFMASDRELFRTLKFIFEQCTPRNGPHGNAR